MPVVWGDELVDPESNSDNGSRRRYEPPFHQCVRCRETVSPQFVKTPAGELCQACWRSDRERAALKESA